MKLFLRTTLLTAVLSFFSVSGMSQCTNAANYGVYPNAVFTNSMCDGTMQQIAGNCYAGEYSMVSVTTGSTYLFSSSIGTDFLTITEDDGVTVLNYGTMPVQYTAVFTGTVYFFTHTDALCGESNVDRERNVSCTLPAGCTTASLGQAPNTTYVPDTCDGSDELITNAGNAGEYSKVAVTAGNVYTFSSSVITDYLTITANDGTSVFTAGTTPVTYTALTTDTVWFYNHLDDQCGEDIQARSRFVSCSGPVPCTEAIYGQYPGGIFTPSACEGLEEPITFDGAAGQFSVVSVIAGNTYAFTSSVTTDYLTITADDGTTVLASGTTPVYLIQAPTTGQVLFFNHTNIACGNDTDGRTRSVACYYTIPCLSATYGVKPEAAYNVQDCSGTVYETILTDGFAGEYSLINVLAGNIYYFASSENSDYLTISDATGTTAYIAGTGNIGFVAPVNGAVRFYTHLSTNCDDDQTPRERQVKCLGDMGVEESAADGFRLYPNPANDLITISAEAPVQSIDVLSIDGKVLLQVIPTELATNIAIGSLQNGTYFVRLLINGQVVVKELIKQ